MTSIPRDDHGPTLVRGIGLLALAATGICSMLGAAINFIPFTIQRNVPGIGPHVLLAYGLAAVPAIFAALAYAVLSSAMPRAGGSYVYASRGLNPYLGFVASFSQWFGLSVAIGVVSYMVVQFLADAAMALGFHGLGAYLLVGWVRMSVALAFLWLFVGVNLRGVRAYSRTLVPLMFLMFAAGMVVIVTGFAHEPAEFAAAVSARDGVSISAAEPPAVDFVVLLSAAVVLFTTFIGFDSIAQAGGEAKRPNRSLPLAIGLAVGTVGSFYFLFTAAVYHAVPWSYVADRAGGGDISAPALLGYLLSPGWTVLIIGGAAIALINDLPAMLLSVSRSMFAWAEDGVFPRAVARIHPRWRTPWVAILLSALVASATIVACQLGEDFMNSVDILAHAMLVNFLVVCVTVLTLPRNNPELAREVRFLANRTGQVSIGWLGILTLGGFLAVHVAKDLGAENKAWYFRSTWIWLAVLAVASALFAVKWRALRRRGVDVEAVFGELPPE